MVMDVSTAFWIGTGFSIFFGVVGYYVGERGLAGVKNDLVNVQLDIAHLKGVTSVPTTIVTTP